MNLTHDQKKGLVAHMLKLAQSDGRTDVGEVIFIQSLALKMQLTKQDMDDVVSYPDRYLSSTPYLLEDQLEFLYYLLSLMNIDLHVDEGEKRYIQSAAYKLRLSSAEVDKAITYMEAHVKDAISLDEFLAEMKG